MLAVFCHEMRTITQVSMMNTTTAYYLASRGLLGYASYLDRDAMHDGDEIRPTDISKRLLHDLASMSGAFLVAHNSHSP